jgi:hypothetical protein
LLGSHQGNAIRRTVLQPANGRPDHAVGGTVQAVTVPLKVMIGV